MQISELKQKQPPPIIILCSRRRAAVVVLRVITSLHMTFIIVRCLKGIRDESFVGTKASTKYLT